MSLPQPVPVSLAQSATSGVKWNFASQAGRQVTQLLTTIVLARLLVPADFGLLGMATVVIGFVDLFKDLGTSAAVIQGKEVSDELLSSVFWANAAFGILGTLALVAAAPLAAMYYHEPRVTAVLRILALSFAVSGISILQQALFERKLAFRILAKVEIAGVVCGAVVGIGSAVWGAGVWALVAQTLATVTVITILLWYFSQWRPRLLFHWQEIRSISSYSLNLAGFNVFNYFSRNADYLLIGRFLGATPLGIYTLAYRIMLYPLQTITTVISRVMFPVYSQLQDDDARFRSAYLRTAGMIALITFPMMVGLWVVAKPFVLSVFGTKWALAIPLIKILAPIGMAQSIGATVGAIYQAKGRTDVMFRWGVASGMAAVAAFAVGLRWGIVGVATAYAIVTMLVAVPSFTIPFQYIGLRLSEFAAALARPLLGSVLMAAVVLIMRTALGVLSDLAVLEVLVAAGVMTYALASWIVNREQLREAFALLTNKS
ncbi:MAG: MOP flippase family protein [Terriglobales bacterium]